MNQSKINRYRQSEELLLKTYQMSREEHYIHIEKYNIKVRVQSIGKGKPVLLIHGGPNGGSTWLQLASLLPDFQCLILDRPGCGLSEAVSYKSITLEKIKDIIVHVVDDILKHFELMKIPILSSSFGSYWALRYTLERPDKIEKLIIEGCPALVEEMQIPAFMKSMVNPILKWLIPKLPTSNSYSKKIMKEIGHTYSIDNELIDNAFIDWYVSLCNNTETMKNDIAIISQVIKKGEMNPEFMLYDKEIGRINIPMLWLWGEDDTFGRMDIGNRLNSLTKDSVIYGFKNSGHLPWLDQPEEHAKKIKHFLMKQRKESNTLISK